MKSTPIIQKIIEAGLKKDSSKVLNYSYLLIEILKKDKENEAAEKIERILHNNKNLDLQLKSSTITSLQLPVDQESRFPLGEIKKFSKEDSLLILNNTTKEYIEDFINIIKRSEELHQKDVKIHRTILLYGPPGTGKSQAAKYIAANTDLPLITVRMDGLVSSYLGSTAKNIKSLFDFIQKTNAILFLDEFDAIAKMRDDSNELGELKRVVNTLLQNIDFLDGEIPIIAATNHEHLLDAAVWRRFNYKVHFNYPYEKDRLELIKLFMGPLNIKFNEKGYKILTAMTESLSGAEIKIFCDMMKSDFALNKVETIDEKYIFSEFMKYRNRMLHKGQAEFRESDIDFIKKLRQNNKRLFNYRTISGILNKSLGSVGNIIKEVKKNG